jgi:Fe-S-cluster containining protein
MDLGRDASLLVPVALPVPKVCGDLARVRLSFGGRFVPLPEAVLDVVRAFDGHRDIDEICHCLSETVGETPREAVVALVSQLDDQNLLEPPAWERLPVEALPGTRFSCRKCGSCCRRLEIGPLTDEDISRLSCVSAPLGHPLEDILVQHRTDTGWENFLRRGEDGCVFLDGAGNLCRVHAAVGAEAQALACQAFPLRLTFVPGALRLSLSSQCLHRHSTRLDGQPIDEQGERIGGLRALGLGRDSPFPRWTLFAPRDAGVSLAPDFVVPFEQYRQLETEWLAMLMAGHDPLTVRLDAILRRVSGIVACPRTSPNEGEAGGPGVFGRFCDTFLQAARDHDPALADLVERGERRSDGASVERDALAADFLAQSMWSFDVLRQTGSVLTGLVVAVFHHMLASRTAVTLSPADYNLAHARVGELLGRLDIRADKPLLAFAFSPVLT